MGVSIREAVSELHAVWVVGLEEEAEVQLVGSSGFVVLAVGLGVEYFGAAPPPLILLRLLITNLHAIIIQAGTLGKPLNNKLNLTLNPLDSKKKPSRNSLRIKFLHKGDLVGGRCDLLHRLDVARFEIATEYGVTDGDYFAIWGSILTMFFAVV